MVKSIGVGDGGGAGEYVPPKFGKIFFGQLLCKIRAFLAENDVKFGNFVNFWANIIKIGVFR